MLCKCWCATSQAGLAEMRLPSLFRTTGSQVKILKGFPRQQRGLRVLFELNKNSKQQSTMEVGLENYIIRVFFISKTDHGQLAMTLGKEEETGCNRSQHIALDCNFLSLFFFLFSLPLFLNGKQCYVCLPQYLAFSS